MRTHARARAGHTTQHAHIEPHHPQCTCKNNILNFKNIFIEYSCTTHSSFHTSPATSHIGNEYTNPFLKQGGNEGFVPQNACKSQKISALGVLTLISCIEQYLICTHCNLLRYSSIVLCSYLVPFYTIFFTFITSPSRTIYTSLHPTLPHACTTPSILPL